jgi:putative zinc finger/helix-turn-helix YgiT family protein
MSADYGSGVAWEERRPKMTYRRLFCPNCCAEQKCRVENRTETYSVRGESITVDGPVAVCNVCGERVFDEELEGKLFRMVYDEYRKRRGIISPGEIASVRGKYGLSQRALSRLLGWGLVTIQRYEKGAIPDEAHNLILKSLRSPDYMNQLIESNADALTDRERRRLEERVEVVRSTSELQRLMGAAAPSLENGFRRFDLDKMEQMIIYFATRCKPLWKTKLMKLLFYADFGFYRKFSLSISGARYARLPRGPVPDGYDVLLNHLERERMVELQPEVCGDCEGERVVPLVEFDDTLFDSDELSLLERTASALGSRTASSLSDMSHNEVGWRETATGMIISYSFADQLTGL